MILNVVEVALGLWLFLWHHAGRVVQVTESRRCSREQIDWIMNVRLSA